MIRWVDLGPFEPTGSVGVCTNERDLHAFMRRIGRVDTCQAWCEGAGASMWDFSHGNLNCAVICLDWAVLLKAPWTVACGRIAHEASHATDALEEWIGERKFAGETRAYLVQQFTEFASSTCPRKEGKK